jgi:hypothetical protein
LLKESILLAKAKHQSHQWKTSNCLENRTICNAKMKDKNNVDLGIKGIACYKACYLSILLYVLEDLARNLSEHMMYFAGQMDSAS